MVITLRDGAEPNVAKRVQDYTPYFEETIELRPAMAASLSNRTGPYSQELDSESDDEHYDPISIIEGSITDSKSAPDDEH